MPVIYKITNTTNGKIYIGKSTKDDPSYYGSGIKITAAVKKYGRESFTRIVVEYCDEHILNEREKHWISVFQSTIDQIGYNISDGGQGGNHYWNTLSSDEREIFKKKLSDGQKCRVRKPHTEETRQKMSNTHNKFESEYYKKRAEKKCKSYTCIHHESKSIFHVYNIKKFCCEHSLSWGKMLYNARTKKSYTEGGWSCREGIFSLDDDIISIVENEINQAQQIIKSQRGWERRADKNPMYGKKHRPETIEKIKYTKRKFE